MTHRTLRHCSIVVFVLSVGCASCGTDEVEVIPGAGTTGDPLACPAPGPDCVPTDPPPDLNDACPDTRWVAIRSGNACTTVQGVSGNWVGSLVFDPNDPSGVGQSLPPHLRKYCGYEWDSAANPEVNLLQSQNFVALERDCLVVSAASVDAVGKNMKALANSYFEQVDALGRLPMPKAKKPAPARVAVVDSTPDGIDRGLALLGTFPHGRDVARIIRFLACPDESAGCLAAVSHHLALPLLDPDTEDFANGGYFGTRSHLARAVWDALLEVDDVDEVGLIINLSLGWEGRYGGHFDGKDFQDLGPSSRQVFEALRTASCAGALVIAAAGNDSGGPDRAIGPIYPAAWETKLAPSSTECAKMGLKVKRASKTPLLYSVGAVDGADVPLISTRRKGRPRLAAPGLHATAKLRSGGVTKPMTGTSAATAVVSAAAAAVWAYRPDLAADEVMAVVLDSGAPLGDPADYCRDETSCTGPEWEIRRVGICPAIEKACGRGLGACPSSVPACIGRPAYSDSRLRLSDDALAELDAGPERTVSAAAYSTRYAPLSVCDNGPIYFRPADSYPEVACGRRQFYGGGASPFSHPTPGTDPCTVCLVNLQSAVTPPTLYLDIDPGYGNELSNPVLHVEGQGDYVLPDVTLGGGDAQTIVGIPYVAPSGSGSVPPTSVSFQVLDASGARVGSVESQLISQ